MENNLGNVMIYQTDDGLTKIHVKLEEETVWLSQQQLVELYQTSKSNISEHIKKVDEYFKSESKYLYITGIKHRIYV